MQQTPLFDSCEHGNYLQAMIELQEHKQCKTSALLLVEGTPVQFYACTQLEQRAQQHRIDASWINRKGIQCFTSTANELVLQTGSIACNFIPLPCSNQENMLWM